MSEDAGTRPTEVRRISIDLSDFALIAGACALTPTYISSVDRAASRAYTDKWDTSPQREATI